MSCPRSISAPVFSNSNSRIYVICIQSFIHCISKDDNTDNLYSDGEDDDADEDHPDACVNTNTNH